MYDIQKLESALLKADAAGDTSAAQEIAKILHSQMQSASQATAVAPEDPVDKFQRDARNKSPLQKGLIALGSGVHDTLSGAASLMGLKPEGSLALKDDFQREATANVIGDSWGLKGAQMAGQALPGVAVAAGAAPVLGTAATAPALVGTAASIGGLEGAAIAKGQGAGTAETLASGAIGAATAGMFESFGPKIAKFVGDKAKKLLNKPTLEVISEGGEINPQLVEELKAFDLTPDDLLEDTLFDLKKAGNLTPEEQARYAALKNEGLDPTRAQVSRNADDFQEQQELFKTNTKVRNAIEKQEALLTTRFNNQVLDAGATSGATVPVMDALVSKATALDSKISDLYKQARAQASDQQVITFKRVEEFLKKNKHLDSASGNVISAALGEMKKLGYATPKPKKTPKNAPKTKVKIDGLMNTRNVVPPAPPSNAASVDQAETFRQFFNGLYDETKPSGSLGNSVLRQAKQMLDDDVFSAVGGDLFSQARAAKAAFEKELTRAKISKFDSRKRNIVRDVLENKISPENFVKDTMASKTYRASDIEQLKTYVMNESPDAVNSMRADTLAYIRDNAFFGPKDADGYQAISRAKLEKVMNTIGDQKLKALLEPAQYAFLKRMLKVTELREPVRGTALGMGPSAQAINALNERLQQTNGALSLFMNVYGELKTNRAGKLMIRPLGGDQFKIPNLNMSQDARQITNQIGAAAVSGSLTNRGAEEKAQ